METAIWKGKTKVAIKIGDITQEEVEAIVNAANPRLLGGGGVDGAIHKAAGPTLLKECKKIGWCEPGDAVVTSGGDLRARFVIHTVGPIWRGGIKNEDTVLENSFLASLMRALEKKIKTVAFPAISTGAYGFPVDRAAKISLCAIKKFLNKYPDSFQEIRIVLFNESTYRYFEKALKYCF